MGCKYQEFKTMINKTSWFIIFRDSYIPFPKSLIGKFCKSQVQNKTQNHKNKNTSLWQSCVSCGSYHHQPLLRKQDRYIEKMSVLPNFWLLPILATRSGSRWSDLTVRLTPPRAGVEIASAGTMLAENASGREKEFSSPREEPLTPWKWRNTPFVLGSTELQCSPIN